MNYAVLYWITVDPDKDDIYTEGYVGITSNFERRLATHRRGGGFITSYDYDISDYKLKIIASEEYFTDSERNALMLKMANLEKHYRPHKNIGLNKSTGGSPPSYVRKSIEV